MDEDDWKSGSELDMIAVGLTTGSSVGQQWPICIVPSVLTLFDKEVVNSPARVVQHCASVSQDLEPEYTYRMC